MAKKYSFRNRPPKNPRHEIIRRLGNKNIQTLQRSLKGLETRMQITKTKKDKLLQRMKELEQKAGKESGVERKNLEQQAERIFQNILLLNGTLKKISLNKRTLEASIKEKRIDQGMLPGK